MKYGVTVVACVQVVVLCISTVIPQQKFIGLCLIGSQCIGRLALPGVRHLVPSYVSLFSVGVCSPENNTYKTRFLGDNWFLFKETVNVLRAFFLRVIGKGFAFRYA